MQSFRAKERRIVDGNRAGSARLQGESAPSDEDAGRWVSGAGVIAGNRCSQEKNVFQSREFFSLRFP